MKRIKKYFPRSLDREATASNGRDNSTGVRQLTGSTLIERQPEEESGPWGLMELCAGRDPILE